MVKWKDVFTLGFIELLIIILALWAIVKGIHDKNAILLGEGIFIIVGINYIKGVYLVKKIKVKVL